MTTVARGGHRVLDVAWDGFTYFVMNGGRGKRPFRVRVSECIGTLRERREIEAWISAHQESLSTG